LNGEQIIMRVVQRLRKGMQNSQAFRQDRPFVTVSYAQSLDGSIAEIPNHPLALSGEQSVSLTHSIRAAHHAILVGIGTVLSDNPALTVRHSPGESPQPVILDSRLRFPLFSRMLEHPARPPWIFTLPDSDPVRMRALENAGARVFRMSHSGSVSNGKVELCQVLARLKELQIRSILVEGGAQVITSFLASRFIDQFIITIAPVLIGGVRAFETGWNRHSLKLPRLRDIHQEILGEDVVVIGTPSWT
jgi:3,4-dihydroxy 2-butanone 4-phosphate synthase/GTP cyclohydrolase II